jgi:hypothetical protein
LNASASACRLSGVSSVSPILIHFIFSILNPLEIRGVENASDGFGCWPSFLIDSNVSAGIISYSFINSAKIASK